MYCDFYQLTEPPFNVTPDPKFLYLNARYREAIASLNYGITQRKGFITLIGEAGTGKTTLLNKLLEDLDPNTKSVFIFNTNVTFEEILEYIFAEFGLPIHNGKKLYMLQKLNAFLLEELRGGTNVALLIDEAQDLEFSVLEDLRLLSNLETAKEKILQIVLSGQPELGQKLSNPVLRQLRQRIGINCRLLPLSRDEITEYIQYRLQAAGCPDLKLFSREAEEQIYRFSRGIPRLVNVVCDNALVIGYALGKKRIGADVITEAAADLLSVEAPSGDDAEPAVDPSTAPPVAAPPTRWRARFGVMSVIVVAIVVGLLSVGRTILSRHPAEEHVRALPQPQRLEVIRPGSEQRGAGVEPPIVRPGGGEADAAADSDTHDVADTAVPGSARLAVAQPEPPAPVAPAVRPPQPPAEVAAADDTLPDRSQGPKPGEEHQVLDLKHELASATRPDAVQPVAQPRPVKESVEPHAPTGETAGEPKAAEPERATVAKVQAPLLEPEESFAKEPLGRAMDNRQEPALTNTSETPNEKSDHSPHLDGVRFANIVVQSGDSMSKIAYRKYGQSTYTILDLLKLANPELTDIDLITAGQTIRVPELGEGFPILNDGSGHYALLVFSTPLEHRATGLENALRSRGFDARVTTASVGVQKPMFRVLLPGFADRDEVVAVGKRLQKLFREDTRIAQLGD